MSETYYFNSLMQMNRKTNTDKLNNMNNIINGLISEINSKNLSPIEQVMYVYDYVKTLELTENDISADRKFVDGVLFENKATSSGFSDTFNEILKRMGFKTAILESYVGNESHMNSIVEIKDLKYDINGIYNFDPSIDSTNKESYAFFGRTMEELNKLKKKRIGRGCSIVLTEGNTGNNLEEALNDIPLRTMNIINGFFPSKENLNYLKNIYSQGNDKTKWGSLNEPYMFQLFQLGFKFRRTERIPLDTLEQIILNVAKTKNSNDEVLESEILKIKTETNKEFDKYYNDPRLKFSIKSENYIDENMYMEYINKISQIYSTKTDEEKLISKFEFINGQERKVIHKLFRINEETSEELIESEFDLNYDFERKMLIPLFESYLNYSDYPIGKINPPQYANFNIRDFSAISRNGLSFFIEAGNLELIKYLESKVNEKKIMQQNFPSDDINYKSNGKSR